VRTASYAVIRYIADPARNEPLNVGILVWDAAGYELRLDEAAAARVIRDHPFLPSDALRALQPSIDEQLQQADPFSPDAIGRLLANQRGHPVNWSDARITSIDEAKNETLATAADRLVVRLVHPRRRGGGGGLRPVELFERHLAVLVKAGAISRGHVFPQSKTGIHRSVDFFANHGANVALDAVKLAYQKADDVLLRADAQANKVQDILAGNDVTYLVYVELSNDPKMGETNDAARRIVESAGALVSSDFEATAIQLQRAALTGDQSHDG
jgi:hypothetical protein